MARNLTDKREKFCRLFVEKMEDASAAYRGAFRAENMKPETVHRCAHELLKNPKITARIEELRAEIAKRHEVTEDSLIAELEEARDLAKNLMNPAAMVSATMGKAKITGFDKKIIQHQNPDGSAIVPVTRIEIVPGDNGAG